MSLSERIGKVLNGIVISNKMQKTAIVKVERHITHSLYKKVIKRSTKYYVHDEDNKLKIGDKVKIHETRPLSKCKSWALLNVMKGDES